MPRKAPDQVIEHRISLSNFERSQIIDQLEKNRTNSMITSGISQVGTVLGSGVLLYGLGAYFGIGILSAGKETFDKVTNTLSDYLFEAFSMGIKQADPVKEARFASAFDRLDEAIVAHRELDLLASAELEGFRANARNTGDNTATPQMLAVVEKLRYIKNLRTAIEITRDRVREFNRAYLITPDGNNCPEWLGLPTWQDLLQANDTYPDNVMPDWLPLFQS